MKCLVDRCAGRRLADWLRGQGHDVLEARSLGPDPGDRELLEIAAKQERVLVTIDTDLKAPRLAGDLGSAALTSEVYPPWLVPRLWPLLSSVICLLSSVMGFLNDRENRKLS